MSLPPAKAREAILVALFALTSHEESQEGLSPEGLVQSVMHQLKITKARSKEALETAFLVFEKREQLKAEILKTCPDYSWNRLGRVEQVILLLCSYELKEEKIPTKVLLAEGTRLAKKFASLSASRFVNAVLDAFCQKKQIEVLLPADPMVDQLHEALEKGADIQMESESSQDDACLDASEGSQNS
jgi:transcription antitermination factor NusB